MTTATLTLTEFLLARIAEDEAAARLVTAPRSVMLAGYTPIRALVGLHDAPGSHDGPVVGLAADPARVLAECAAKRRIVELHENWPVLVEQPVEFDLGVSTDPNTFAYRASQRIQWLTTKEYRQRFGDEPATAPMLAALAAVYSAHPDYDSRWKA